MNKFHCFTELQISQVLLVQLLIEEIWTGSIFKLLVGLLVGHPLSGWHIRDVQVILYFSRDGKSNQLLDNRSYTLCN